MEPEPIVMQKKFHLVHKCWIIATDTNTLIRETAPSKGVTFCSPNVVQNCSNTPSPLIMETFTTRKLYSKYNFIEKLFLPAVSVLAIGSFEAEAWGAQA